MKRLIPSLWLLSLIGCGWNETIFAQQIKIDDPPPIISGVQSGLFVPKACPVYSPGGGDVDTVEAPFPSDSTSLCAVDDAGNAYGIVTGDAPTAQLATLPGNHEIGVYMGFKVGRFSPDKLVLTGTEANVMAWAVGSQDCCAENNPDGLLPVQIIALGPQGMLVSVGSFGASPEQIAFRFHSQVDGQNYLYRFYVNGAPPFGTPTPTPTPTPVAGSAAGGACLLLYNDALVHSDPCCYPDGGSNSCDTSIACNAQSGPGCCLIYASETTSGGARCCLYESGDSGDNPDECRKLLAQSRR